MYTATEVSEKFFGLKIASGAFSAPNIPLSYFRFSQMHSEALLLKLLLKILEGAKICEE